MTHTAKLLSKAREKIGVSAKTLAKQNFMDYSSFLDFEMGRRVPRHVINVIRTAEAYKVDYAKLFTAIAVDLIENGEV